MNTQRNLSKILKPHQKAAFVECESIVAEYQNSPFKAGKALQRIRDARLYREFFPNFDAYCGDKWGISRSVFTLTMRLPNQASRERAGK